MYIHKSNLHFLTVALLLSSSFTSYTRDTWDRVKDAGVVIAGVGAATAVGACIWGALQPPDPEDVLVQTGKTYDSVVARYSNATGRLRGRQQNEDLLHDFALQRMQELTSGLSSQISVVVSVKKEAYQAAGRTHDCQLRKSLERRINDLQLIEADLTALNSFLSNNKAYFDLVDLTEELRVHHARELAVCNDARQQEMHKRADLQICLGLRSADGRCSSYPYLDYAKRVAHDIHRLDRAITKAGHGYPKIMREARNLLSSFEDLQRLVISDQEYRYSQQAYNREQREKERLEVERQRLLAEQERARAEQARARAEQDRAHAEWVHARAERDRACIDLVRCFLCERDRCCCRK